MQKPDLNKLLFGDTDQSKIDWEKNANSVIVRVVDRGSFRDFWEIRKFYGDEKIIEATTKARCVFREAVHVLSSFYSIPLEKFRCYKNDSFPEFPLVFSSM